MSGKHSPYHILDLPVGAAEKEIRKAYRRLAMRYHPDRNPGDTEAEEQFKQVQWAYETLLGGSKMRENHKVNTSPWGFDDPFSDFSHPFFNFYMLAKKHFFNDQDKEPPSKKRRGKAKKR